MLPVMLRASNMFLWQYHNMAPISYYNTGAHHTARRMTIISLEPASSAILVLPN